MRGIEDIHNQIYEIRGQRIMLDKDLAARYGIETKVLNQAVKRNAKRFEGDDFMFQLTKEEYESIRSRSQFVTLNKGRGSNIKYLPKAFTALGVAMLSSVLNSDTAIEINRQIMRAFVSYRQVITYAKHEDLMELRKEILKYIDEVMENQNDINEMNRAHLDVIDEAIAELHTTRIQSKPRRPIGFIQPKPEE
jgi:maltooligosyltrehalose synthase